MDLTLSFEEQQLLLNILEQRHRELLTEISHTQYRDFKLTLKRNEKLLEALLSRWREAPVDVQV